MTKKPTRRSADSADSIILQNLWLAAHGDQDGNPIEIPCQDPTAAKSLRMKLYNAVRNAKNFPLEYPLLEAARQACEVVIDKSKEAVVIVRRKQVSSSLSNVLDALKSRGVDPIATGMQTAQDREIEDSLRRLTEQVEATPKPAAHAPSDPLAGLATERPENPFFSRK